MISFSFLALTTGETEKLRDIPRSVVKHYAPSTPFYGHVHGKLGFGLSENGDYEVGGWGVGSHNCKDNRETRGCHFFKAFKSSNVAKTILTR